MAVTVYVDNTKETATLTGSQWKFTNASTTVTEQASGGDAQAELAAGNYVRTNGGSQWYKVASVTDANNFEITPTFQQNTSTDTCKKNSENGQGTATAYAHLNQATTDEVRAAGDIIKVRANQAHVYAAVDITFDESGSPASYITLKGCDSVDDPWSDGSDIKPIIDFSDTAFQVYFLSISYWKVQNLEFIQSEDVAGALNFYFSFSVKVENCVFRDNGVAANTIGLRAFYANPIVTNCTFYSNKFANIVIEDGLMYMEGCTLNGGAAPGTSYGMQALGSTVFIKDTTFGVTTDHGTADISVVVAKVYGRNVKFDSATEVAVNTVSSIASIEDDEQTHEAYRAWLLTGVLVRTTEVNRSGAGGSPWSRRGIPNGNCTSEQPLYLVGDWLRGFPVYLNGTQQTVTVYAYATSWASLPTVSQFVVELEHYEGAADWEIDTSSDTFAANDQWESFSITLTPGAAGPAYLRVYLKDYEDGSEKIYIDPEPVIS